MLDELVGAGIEAAPQIGALEKTQAVSRRTSDGKALPTGLTECLSHCVEVEGAVHGIARPGVVELKVQLRPGGETSTRPSQGDASGRECTELVPGVGRGKPGFGFIRGHPDPTGARGFQRR